MIAQVQNWKRKLSNHLSINLAYSKIVKMTACTTQRTTDSGANFWVGLARGGDGGFSWVDGTPFDLEFWLDGEPNSSVSDNKEDNSERLILMFSRVKTGRTVLRLTI